MLEFLRTSKDDYTTADLVGKVSELAEKYPLMFLFNRTSKIWDTGMKTVRLNSKLCFFVNTYSVVFFLLYFVHMHLIMNGSLRPWTPCFYWVETWFILISQAVSWTCSLRVSSQISTLTQIDQFVTPIPCFWGRFWECWGGQEVEAVCCWFLHFSAARRARKTAAALPSGHQLGESTLFFWSDTEIIWNSSCVIHFLSTWSTLHNIANKKRTHVDPE